MPLVIDTLRILLCDGHAPDAFIVYYSLADGSEVVLVMLHASLASLIGQEGYYLLLRHWATEA